MKRGHAKTGSGNRCYPLRKIQYLVRENRAQITLNAMQSAYLDFGWNEADILDAILKLRAKDFYKSEESKTMPGICLDFYRAYGLKVENVYIHLYVATAPEELIVNSFKKLDTENAVQ